MRSEFDEEAQLHELGVEIAASGVVEYLVNRLGIVAYRRENPEVAEATVDQPVFIVGQPRTGTTILHDLLALDPALRAPRTWEVDRPLPPPETAQFDTDPRIDEVDATLSMADSLIPGFTSFHPMGARLAQECVRMTGSDFRSLIFPVQYRVPAGPGASVDTSVRPGRRGSRWASARATSPSVPRAAGPSGYSTAGPRRAV